MPVNQRVLHQRREVERSGKPADEGSAARGCAKGTSGQGSAGVPWPVQRGLQCPGLALAWVQEIAVAPQGRALGEAASDAAES